MELYYFTAFAKKDQPDRASCCDFVYAFLSGGTKKLSRRRHHTIISKTFKNQIVARIIAFLVLHFWESVG